MVGRPKAAHMAQGINDYLERMKPYGGGRLQAVRAPRAGKGRPPREIMAEEARRLLAVIQPRDLVWALDVRGRGWNSGKWADSLAKARQGHWSRLVLVVGGAWGLGPELLERANRRVSLGPITLPHELAALVAAEQLYRACTILAGTPYHRA
jgi:23S rRNA (pseudouridine1915-N3)-methyltransferase